MITHIPSGSSSVFLRRVVMKNYKSIGSCDVRLSQPLTILVGPNGAGKSNFLDGLRFVSDALESGLDNALQERGGINEVRRRTGGHPTHFSILLEFALNHADASFSFRVGAQQGGGYTIQKEECRIVTHDQPAKEHFYAVENGIVKSSSITIPPAVLDDRFYLVNVSGFPEFRAVYDALLGMRFHNFNPELIKTPQRQNPKDYLERDGRNVASVLGNLERNSKETLQQIWEFLERIVPGVKRVEKIVYGSLEAPVFRQLVAGQKDLWRFPAINMSDGTLRVLGILVALFQAAGSSKPVPLVGIEEPETALNPGAAGVLLDSLRSASQYTQVLVTSHSPELLDDKNIHPDSILAVTADKGNTQIGTIDQVGRAALKDHLYTVGELLRLNKLQPQFPKKRQAVQSPQLFEA
jgi:predicted ATPase